MVISHERSGTHFLIDSICANTTKFRNNVINVYTENDYENPITYKSKVCDHLLSFVDRHTSQIFKSHHKAEFLEDILDLLSPEFEIFYIDRNPLDVLTSLYHYYQRTNHPNFHPDIENFLFYLEPKDPWYSLNRDPNNTERLRNHVTEWKKQNINFVKYEDLINDYTGTIEQIFSILDIPRPDTYIKPPLGGINPRKGIIDDHVNLFTEPQISKLKRYFNE